MCCGIRVGGWLLAGLWLCGPAVLVALRADEPGSVVRTVAGTGQRGPFVVSGESLQTAVNEPFGLSMREPGVLYVCEVGGHVIRRVDLSTGRSEVVRLGRWERRSFWYVGSTHLHYGQEIHGGHRWFYRVWYELLRRTLPSDSTGSASTFRRDGCGTSRTAYVLPRRPVRSSRQVRLRRLRHGSSWQVPLQRCFPVRVGVPAQTGSKACSPQRFCVARYGASSCLFRLGCCGYF